MSLIDIARRAAPAAVTMVMPDVTAHNENGVWLGSFAQALYACFMLEPRDFCGGQLTGPVKDILLDVLTNPDI